MARRPAFATNGNATRQTSTQFGQSFGSGLSFIDGGCRCRWQGALVGAVNGAERIGAQTQFLRDGKPLDTLDYLAVLVLHTQCQEQHCKFNEEVGDWELA